MRNVISMTFMLGMVFSQSAGYFANSGETIIGIEGQYDSESDANSSSTTTTLGGSYVLNGNLEVAGFIQWQMLMMKQNLTLTMTFLD